MSALDDFFSDSESAVKECLHCGRTDGELLVAIEDAGGPTHWIHAECRSEMDAEKAKQAEIEQEKVARHEAMDRYEEE
jgi:hypothetical protein